MTSHSELPWTHFYRDTNGRVTGFGITRCETCNRLIQEANGVGIHEPPSTLLRLGMIQLDTLPPEGWYNEATDMESCDGCNGDPAT